MGISDEEAWFFFKKKKKLFIEGKEWKNKYIIKVKS